MKICKVCNKNKDLSCFKKDRTCKDGHLNTCKDCKSDSIKKSNIKYYQNNKDKINSKKKKYARANIQKIREYKRNWQRNKSKMDLNFKISRNLRRRLNHVIKGTVKQGSSIKNLGCSIDFLIKYLESKFKPGMSWDNYGTGGWHLDHIKPLSSFNLNNRKEFLKAVNYRNIQPLWAIQNLKKNNKI